MGEIGRELRYGLRALRRSPGFTATVVLTLGLGVAANVAIFSVLEALVLRPLPVKEPEKLVLLSPGDHRGRTDEPLRGQVRLYSDSLYRRLRAETASFADLAAQDSLGKGAVVAEPGREPKSSALANGARVTLNYFPVVGVALARGRGFSAQHTTPEIILSDAYWKRAFAGDDAILGRRLLIDGEAHTVVGITPPGFRGAEVGRDTDFWTALPEGSSADPGPHVRWLLVLGRLRPGVTAKQAEVGVNVTLQQLLAARAPDVPPIAAGVEPAAVRIVVAAGAGGVSAARSALREPLYALMVGVGLLLAIVCLNVAHLLLSRAMRRRRELGIRAALGANRARLLRMFVVEASLLAGAGVTVGSVASGPLADALVALAGSGRNPLHLEVALNAPVLAFGMGLGAMVVVGIGLVPGWRASRVDAQETLRAAATSGGGRRLTSRVLLALQVVISMALLVSAGLLTTSLRKLRDQDKGFDERGVQLVQLRVRPGPMDEEQKAALLEELMRRVNASGLVRDASLSFTQILGGARVNQDVAAVGSTRETNTHVFSVSGSYFATVGMRLLRGRAFGAEDRRGTPWVAVINQRLARELFGDENALGKRFVVRDPQVSATFQVIGIVENARIDNLRANPPRVFYRAIAQGGEANADGLQVRPREGIAPARLAAELRQIAAGVHPGLEIRSIKSMETQVDQSLVQERLLAILSGAFGLTALFLVCVGLYGVVAQWAAHRTRELGVRLALGATIGGIRWLVLRQAFVLVLAGVLMGLPVAIACARSLQGFLFGVGPVSVGSLTFAALALFAVAALAAYLPARRASRIQPMEALRSE